MRWKSAFSNPQAALCWLSVFVSLLVDFQEAGTKVSEFLPAAIRGLLPLVAIGGTTYFSISILQAIPGCFRRAKQRAERRSPTGRFKACSDNINYCLDIIDTALERERPIGTDGFRKIVVLTQTKLSEFQIGFPDPSTFDPRTPMGKRVWYRFLLNLAIYCETGNLEAARLLMKSQESHD